MKRKRKLKCIKGLSASASSRLRKRVRDERFDAAEKFTWAAEFAMGEWAWWESETVKLARARYNRARALAAECGV